MARKSKVDVDGLDPEFLELITRSLDPEAAAKMQADLQKAAQETQQKDYQQAKIREANAVLTSLYNVTTVVMRTCPECSEKFQTNYKYSRYCSNECLKAALKKRGLAWHPEKSAEDRWQGEPPATISPPTLKVLVQWARAILRDYEAEIDSILGEDYQSQTEIIEPLSDTSVPEPQPAETDQDSRLLGDEELDRWLSELS